MSIAVKQIMLAVNLLAITSIQVSNYSITHTNRFVIVAVVMAVVILACLNIAIWIFFLFYTVL